MDEDERRRKVEAGRAKLASFRQKRAKSDGAGAAKKTQKRKGQVDSQNDRSTEDHHVEPALPSASATEYNNSTNHEDQPLTPKHSPSPVDDLREEELAALTGKEQLKLLQQAVEKRNEIIAKLSSNLQEALASRDQVQVEAQSLAGQLQALQRQLQQVSANQTECGCGCYLCFVAHTSVEFLRIKNLSGTEALNIQQPYHEPSSQEPNISHKEAPSEGSGSSGSQSDAEGETDVETVLCKLRAELEEERRNSQRICSELAEEMEKNKHVLSLLENEKQEGEEERKEREAELQNLHFQLSQLQSQCLEMQQYKEEKEVLNIELQELRRRLQEEEDAGKSYSEKLASSALCFQSLEEEMKRLKEEHTVEVEQVRQLLEEREKELKMKEEEVVGFKASKNWQNQVKAGVSSDETVSIDEANLESGADQGSMNESMSGNLLMERYLSSAPLAHLQYSAITENLDHPQDSLADESNPQWLHNVASGRMERSNVSEQQSEDTNLEKELLSQQCEELREELALKERDLNVLKEEVIKSAEELEEARSRWAQVTEELREALQELEDEKEMRRQFEEELNLKVYEQDSLRSKHCALSEEREQENVVMLTVKETEISAETSLLISGTFPSDEDEKLVGELKEEETALQSHQKQQELLVSSLQEIKQTADLESTEFRDDNQLQTLQHETASTLLSQRTTELDTVLKELQTTRVQILSVQTEVERLEKELQQSLDSLHCAEKEKHELESQISCLREKLTCSEEDRAQAVKERDEHSRREEEMDEQIKKMEQVLEEELEQFEKLLKAKDVEVRDYQMKEKVDEVKALLEKQAQAVEEATEKLKASHQQEIKDLMEKHQQEISDLNTRLETELLKQRASMEEEQKQQISLIKQVTEREHERMISELSAKHNEVVSQLKTEVSLELRESMEAAHQAELQQVQAQKAIELESLRLSLTTVHKSHLERSQENVEQEQTSALIKVQASMQEKFDQEIALLQARHQSEVDQIKRKNQEQQERLLELHQQDMGDYTQDHLTQWEKDAEAMEANFQTSLLEIQNSLSATQTELTSTQASLAETQASIEELQTSSKEQTQKLEELKRALAERDAAVSQLQQEKNLLKQSSDQEISQLWTQLESMRTSRQELGELKEQLLARSSRVDDIERLKMEFNEQKREIKEQNEAELENLRRYFEKRLHATEESHKEEIALLQLKLVEGALEDSLLKMTDDGALSQCQAQGDKDVLSYTVQLEKQREMLDSLTLHLEAKHTMDLSNLRSSLTLSFEEEVQKVRADLTDHYYKELQEMKTRHALDLEQLRAKLSDRHLQGPSHTFIFIHLFSVCVLLGYFFMSLFRFQEEKAAVEQRLIEKYEVSVAELKDKYEAELEHERATLLNTHSKEMDALNAKHKAELDSLSASHKDQLSAKTAEFECKHNEDLERLEETNRAKLEALEAELTLKHQEEKDELEKRMLSNMDTLEATYLKEVQLEEKHREDLIFLNSEHKQVIERHTAEQLSIREELRKELAHVHMEKFKAMAAELSHSQLAAQKESLDTEHCKALEALKNQVLELEQQHSTALQELSQTYTAEKGQLTKQHQVQLQELKGVSARELEACRRELEEESSRQRQHFLEEVELLKVQSEERLQDRINQLKTEFEEQKEAELENLRRSFTSEQEEKEQSYTEKMSQLTAQLQQLDAVVAQLRAEVGCLQGELEGKRAEMETMDTLLQRRERETQEGGNLLKMLTDDLQTAKEERCACSCKLRQVLIEMLRGIVATEELIGQKISARAKTSEQATHQRSISVADLSSEELELTQLLCESLLVSDGEISPGGEEAALSACSRLRHTVDTLLELLNQANTQLEQTHSVHLSLEEKFSQGREDSAQLLEQHKRLMEQLDQEAKLKSQLQVELHKAEGLLEGYMAEKAALEESLQQKETQEERLVEELEDLKLTEEHAILLRHKEHLSAGLGEREKALLAETDRLSQDRLDLQRQAEKDHRSLSLRLRTLERELEEQETRGLETELHHKTHTEDLNQRVQALEKQLKHDRQFIEEQAVEREHERDEFQQEIRRLEAQLRQTPSVDNKGYQVRHLTVCVESLQGVIKDKTEDYSSLLGTCQQAQCDLAERNEEIDKLAGRIRELEQALLNSVESNRCVGQLEQELQKAKLREQELTQDKQALEQQQLSSRLQISALQSKLDETRHCYHDNMRDPTQELKDALDTAQQSLQSKEQEVEVLLGQLETVQRDLNIKEAEVKHLTLQLELLTNSNAAHVNELQEQITALKENVSALTILKEEKEQLCKEDEMDEETLPSALLQEKNHEIDHLNSEIQRLEQELENTSDNKVLEAELEDLRSQVEHLKSEITRVRQDKQEEEERLHEVISTLQAELATLGPNLHEVSDSQDGDSINPSPAPSPEPQNDTIQEQEKKAGPNSLKHELSLTHSTASRSLRSRIKALQSQLETAVAEKEGLERLLLTQEEEYRGYGEEFGKRLKAEREKSDEIQSLLSLKETELEEVTAQLEEEREERKGWKVQAEEAGTLQEEKARLSSQVLELQTNEEERVREIKTLKTKETEMEMEMGILRESSLTLERQVQELRAEVVDMEEQVAQERARIKTLETVKGELSAEREALRRREGQLQEEIEKLQQEVTSLRALIQDLTVKLNENETSQEEAQKEVLTHAEETLAKADTALRQKEVELSKLKEEHQALRTELTALRQGLSTSTERAEKLHEEVQTKDRALIDLEADNQQLKAELQSVQEDLAAQEEELAYQQRELQQLRQQSQQDTLQGYPHKAFEDIVSHHEDSLSSPEVLRRLECSEDRILERFHTSELSGLNNTGLDLPQVKPSPRVVMEPPSHSRTITPDPATQSSHSPRSVSVSENYSILDSLDADKVRELEGLDLTTPSSPLGSTSSLSAPEWASDGYGSNVSSELGARLRLELEQTERLDAQFIEYLRCRGVDPTANTDSAAGSMSYSDDLLSPELQGLLKKVYQESCRILTLSQRRVNPSAQSHVLDLKACSLSLWQQEKRALQETVIALRELLCRMAQRHSQTDDRVDSNWHRDQLQTERRDESQLRAELEESQKQLKCAHDAQQEQKNKTMSLRYVLPNVQVSSEKLRSEVMSLKGQVEQERVACSNLRQELQIEQSRCLLLQEKTRQELLLTEAETRLTEIHSKLADSHRKLDEEQDRCSRQVDELSRRHDADAARDRKFISDLRSQLEQERRQGEELAAVADRLRAELLQSRRRWEEEDRTRREELQKEQEAATRNRITIETLKEQKQEANQALEVEREQSRRQEVELAELKERLRMLKDKEREREEQWEREKRKEMQEQMERERRQERINSKLCELELLRQQDQQRMQELQRTLAELERDEREMAAQRVLKQHQQVFKCFNPYEESKLFQERATLKHKLTCLERQLRRTENELAKVTAETENRPVYDISSQSKRYLRAESFRKALVYQKRYLLLLIGGFQECEQATLCLIAHMGARPSPPVSSKRRPLGRFRAAVQVIIAVSSNPKIINWGCQWACSRSCIGNLILLFLAGPKAEVLRQQQPRSNSDPTQIRDSSAIYIDTLSALVPPSKSPFRLRHRFGLASHSTQDPEQSLTEYIRHLEKVQQRLVGAKQGE
uniref:Pericentrin n=1 Tax=Haplochromis burtoni TaxID=8153 RepID=A0A3Q3BRR7_HAPBU